MFVMRQDKLLKALLSYLGWWINKDMKRLHESSLSQQAPAGPGSSNVPLITSFSWVLYHELQWALIWALIWACIWNELQWALIWALIWACIWAHIWALIWALNWAFIWALIWAISYELYFKFSLELSLSCLKPSFTHLNCLDLDITENILENDIIPLPLIPWAPYGAKETS